MTKSYSNDRTRHLIIWEVPTSGSNAFVEMYINPESLVIQDKKLVNSVRTKGGFILQYWGEDYTRVKLTGSVGSGGIEAINVIRDIYRNEQIALQRILQSQGAATKRRQSLAQLSTSVIMWYMGQGFRGFFEAFNYTEKVSGIFEYTLDFTAVEVIGERKNFLPWHRKPWSTIDSPVVVNGNGSTTGGAYGSTSKIGELNAPVIDPASGLLSDPEYTSRTKSPPDQQKLQDNLAENNIPITPGRLFANTNKK